ncbi:OLC1v1005526C1 [Oldenlandia corymbosa var. corymbosa]|uniref:OLC1v1005526C1 n=1 Tax=Oldenlandia corymbosa var. corymbosa TaxID=529605 RepID=A0AAV1DGU7_OLDCO|nr:OLC1v1005526C1 [Oldenlandia corymbosa var. corymbosa]
MGPTCKRRTTRSSSIRKSTARIATIQKKKAVSQKSSTKMAESPATAAALQNQPCNNIATPRKSSDIISISTSTIEDDYDFVQMSEKSPDYCSPCTTPRSEKFRIPEIQTCPPAPKKQRVTNYSTLTRRPIAFFAPPDVELFFFVALRDIPAA